MRSEFSEFNQRLISTQSSLVCSVGWFRHRPPTGWGAAFQVLELNLSVHPQALIKYRENPPQRGLLKTRCLSNIITSDALPHASTSVVCSCMCSYNAPCVRRYCSYRQIDITFHVVPTSRPSSLVAKHCQVCIIPRAMSILTDSH